MRTSAHRAIEVWMDHNSESLFGMYRYHRTSLLKSSAQTVVNTVNTVGVMGKGLAAEFKRRYPDMFSKYQQLCKEGQFEVGQLWLWKAPDQWILNFPTKRHWRNPSELSYVEAGLKKFVQTYEERGITEISFPRLGCGNGGLDWADVRPMMEHYLSRLPINVYVHDFEVKIDKPEHVSVSNSETYLRSFDDFISQIKKAANTNGGSLQTFVNRSPYRVSVDDTGNLIFFRSGGRDIVSKTDLFELWQLLLKGPVTRQRLPGRTREAAYYLFPLLSYLPYIHPLELANDKNQAAVAIELDRLKGSSTDIRSQDELLWE